MHLTLREFSPLFGPGVLMLVVVGCGGGEGARVAGTVKFSDGAPVPNVRVTARCDATGKRASGTTDQRGGFTLGMESPGERVPAGAYSVIVTEHQSDWDHPTPPKIDSKYGSSTTSGLKLVIDSAESMDLNLVLEPPHGRP